MARSVRRFDNLDGLRGVAALCVAFLHAKQAFHVRISLPNAPLAVDFFFVLSGFVLAHAYGQKLADGRLREYLRARAIRLFPMIWFGTMLGLVVWVCRGQSLGRLAGISSFGFLSLPYLGNGPFSRPIITPLDYPAWSLVFELAASLAFGLGLWRGRFRGAAVVTGIFGMATILVILGRFHVGWEPATFLLGFVRVASGFGLGVWLYSCKWRVPQVHVGWLALILIGMLALPIRSPWIAGVALFALFPLIVLSARERKDWTAACRYSGELSYPLYMIHHPLYFALTPFVTGIFGLALGVGSALLFAFAVLRVFDAPVRKWLTDNQQPTALPITIKLR